MRQGDYERHPASYIILVAVWRRSFLLIEGQRYVERRPFFFDRFEPDTSRVALDQLPAQVQAEACTFNIIHLCIVCAHETAEDASALAFRDAYALILDREKGVALVFILIEIDNDRAA